MSVQGNLADSGGNRAGDTWEILPKLGSSQLKHYTRFGRMRHQKLGGHEGVREITDQLLYVKVELIANVQFLGYAW